jgi:hypothetical protein
MQSLLHFEVKSLCKLYGWRPCEVFLLTIRTRQCMMDMKRSNYFLSVTQSEKNTLGQGTAWRTASRNKREREREQTLFVCGTNTDHCLSVLWLVCSRLLSTKSLEWTCNWKVMSVHLWNYSKDFDEIEYGGCIHQKFMGEFSSGPYRLVQYILILQGNWNNVILLQYVTIYLF